MSTSIDWTRVTAADVDFAIEEFDRLGADEFFASSGFGPTTTYDLHQSGRTYPPKAILGVAYERAAGQRLSPHDFEGGRSGAVKILTRLGFDVRPRN
jgi:hypothetical protein